jgi:hypothetical protein
MWNGLQCEAAIGLVHPEQTTLHTVPIHDDYVVVEEHFVYDIYPGRGDDTPTSQRTKDTVEKVFVSHKGTNNI